MNEEVKKLLRWIADPVIFGNFFISFCAAALTLETYFLLGVSPKFDGFLFFIFFATLALYNFHRLMGVRRIKPEDRGEITGWAARHQFALLMLIIIGLGGMGFFFFQLPPSLGLSFLPIGGVALLYELPLVKFEKRFQRLRNVWFSKSVIITLVWSISTSILPAINAGMLLSDIRIWLVFLERVIFIFTLALCFDARDVIYDEREGVRTIPVVFGEGLTMRLYGILTISFVTLSLIHFLLLHWQPAMGIAMSLSAAATYLVVTRAKSKGNDYYYMFLADGMMILQFLLAAAAAWIH
jgi:4-hydroxybenzoate polyprenyltransferase